MIKNVERERILSYSKRTNDYTECHRKREQCFNIVASKNGNAMRDASAPIP